jgi:competence protein ComGC
MHSSYSVKKGFTLFETLVYLALLSMIVPMLVRETDSLLYASERSYERVLRADDVEFVFRVAAASINGKQASNIHISSGALTVTGEQSLCLKRKGETVVLYPRSDCTGQEEIVSGRAHSVSDVLFETGTTSVTMTIVINGKRYNSRIFLP